VSALRPAPACSFRESAVRSPATAARPARSGWARISARWRAWSACRMARSKAAIMAWREAKGRASDASAATQGECSAISPKASTNSSSLIALTSARGIGNAPGPLISARSLLAQQPRAKLLPLFRRHAGLVAERHGGRADRLRHDLVGMAAKLLDAAEDDALRRRVEALVAGLRRMAHDAMLGDDRQNLAVADLDPGQRCVAPRRGDDNRGNERGSR